MATKKQEEAAKKAAATKSRMARFRKEMGERTSAYIIAALGLVVGLAWNDAIKSSIEYIFPYSADTIFIKYIYAIILTILIVAFSVYIIGWLEDKEKKK